MNGYPVAVSSTDSTSPRQNNTVNIMAKPTRPLIHILAMMARGMFQAAFSTSSAMCTEASAPTNVATFPAKKKKKP